MAETDAEARLDKATAAFERAAGAMEKFAVAATELATAAGKLENTVMVSQEEAIASMVHHLKESRKTREVVAERIEQLDRQLAGEDDAEADAS